MKKGKTTILLVLFILAVLSAVSVNAVNAATLNFSPASVSVKEGQTFYLTVGVNPQGVKNITVKMELKFPADLVRVKSFSFASNSSWIALAQQGYDLVDNTNGVLIKTAGYPGGVSAPITFGTVSFVAKKTGNGLMSSGAGTLVLDTGNSNVFSGANQVSVAVVAAPAASPAATTPAGGAAVSPSPSISPEPEGQAAGQGSLFATIGGVITLGTGNKWLGGLAVLVLIVLIYYLVKYIFRRPKGKMPA